MLMPREADVLDAVQMPGRHQVRVDRSRDALLTDFGRATLSDRYLMPGEDFQDLFAALPRSTATTPRMRSASTIT